MEPRLRHILDRISHASTTDQDCIQSIAGLRRVLKGKLLSDVLSETTDDPPTHRPYDDWQQEINDLTQKLTELQREKAMSDREKAREIKRLAAEIEKLRAKIAARDAPEEAREVYSYDEIIQTMVRKFGKHHGVPAALAERNAHLAAEDPSIGRITSATMQTWRKQDCYPAYVLEQINAMTEDDLLGRRTRWSETERQFLVELYQRDPKQSNKALADACSRKFGRLITECSIKGELNRLRQRGAVPRYRPR